MLRVPQRHTTNMCRPCRKEIWFSCAQRRRPHTSQQTACAHLQQASTLLTACLQPSLHCWGAVGTPTLCCVSPRNWLQHGPCMSMRVPSLSLTHNNTVTRSDQVSPAPCLRCTCRGRAAPCHPLQRINPDKQQTSMHPPPSALSQASPTQNTSVRPQTPSTPTRRLHTIQLQQHDTHATQTRCKATCWSQPTPTSNHRHNTTTWVADVTSNRCEHTTIAQTHLFRNAGPQTHRA